MAYNVLPILEVRLDSHVSVKRVAKDNHFVNQALKDNPANQVRHSSLEGSWHNPAYLK
jgi:hypothetical protein